MNSCCFVNRVRYLGIRAMFRWHPFSRAPFIHPFIAGYFGNFTLFFLIFQSYKTISHSFFLSPFCNLSITGCRPHHLSQISLNSAFSPATTQVWYQHCLSPFSISPLQLLVHSPHSLNYDPIPLIFQRRWWRLCAHIRKDWRSTVFYSPVRSLPSRFPNVCTV